MEWYCAQLSLYGHATMTNAVSRRRGFTIVELLIVIVVIGILAAITIVAFNGVQNKAKASAAQSAAAQANKKIIAYAAENSDQYPTSLTAAGVTDTQGLEYSYNNDTSPRSYGLTATKGVFSYYVSSGTAQPTLGGYPGHSAGGIATVTNQFRNPFFIGAAGPAIYANTSGSTIVDVAGTKYAQGTATSASAAAIRLSSYSDRWSVAANQVVYSRVTVRNANPDAKSFVINLRFYDTSGTASGALLSSPQSASVTISAGATAILSISATAPVGAASVLPTVTRTTALPAVIGDLLQATAVHLGDTDVVAASGDSQGWAWNGEANNSASTGMPL